MIEGSNHKIQNYKFNGEITHKLNRLSLLDNYHVIFALLEDWSLIFLSAIFSIHWHYLYPLSLLIIGSRQRALSTIFHDSAHSRAAKNKQLNTIAGTLLSGFWLFQSLKHYKNSHVKFHHGNLGNECADPDYQYYIKEGLYNTFLTSKTFLWRHVVSVVLFVKAPSYLVYIIKNRATSAKAYPHEFMYMLTCWIFLLLFAYYFKILHLILLFWLVPFITVHAIIGYFIEVSEHYPLLGISNEIMHLSRNRFSHWIEALFFSIHNENYHLIHHLRPNIPFWNMSKAHEVMMEDATYSKVNKDFGGIFISNNKAKPLITKLLTEYFLYSNI